MKKIVYSLVTAVAVVAAMVSCSHKEIEVVDKTGYQYRFVIAETDTRATLDDQGVFWEVGDEVGVFLGEQLASANAPVNATDDPKTIEVTSTEPVATVYAYYPYNAANEAGATTAEIVFPASQAGGSVSAMPMAGLPTEVNVGGEGSANGVIHFVNLGSVIDFRIYSSGDVDYSRETVESVMFWAPGQAVSGEATLDLTDVSYDEGTVTVPEMTMTGGAGTTRATVTQPVGVAANKEAATTPMYLVVAPGTYTGSIVVNTNAASYTFSFENRTFNRNGLRKYSLNLNNAEREAFTKTYTKVNSLSEGVYLLGAYDNSDGKAYVALLPTLGYGASHSDARIVERSSSLSTSDISEITTGDSSILSSEIDLEQSGSNWLVKVRSTGMYLYCPSGNYTIGFTADAAEAGHTASNTNCITYPTNLQFYHSGSEHGFTYYTNKGANNLRFYKLDPTQTSKSQTIWFEQPEGTTLDPDVVLEYDIASGVSFAAPVLKGAKTTVLYGTSDSDIASVDATEGTVTIPGTKRGTVTITATATGEDGYASATASYKIHVINSDLPAVTYYKASVADSGYEYLIVSNGYALANSGDNNVPNATQVSVSENIIVLTETEGLLWTVTNYDGASNYGDFTLTNEGVYLYRQTTSSGYTSTTTLICEETLSANYVPWRYDGEHLWNGNSTLYYAYYNNGWTIATSNPGQSTLLFTSRPALNLSFENAENLTYDVYVGGDFFEPELTGLPAGVTPTYSTSNPDVATVDPATGEVTFVAAGDVVITATLASSANYQGASASYSIHVENSDPNKRYYVKINSLDAIEDGAAFLIVREDGSKAFKPVLDGSVFVSGNAQNAVDVTIVESSKIESKADVDACQVILEKDSGSNYFIEVPQSGGSVLYLVPTRSGSSWSYTYTFAAQSSAASTAFAYTGSAFNIGSNNTGYINYNSGYFRANSSSSSLALYMLEDGRQARSMEFSPNSAELDLANISSFVKPTLTVGGDETTVTFSSSDNAIAEVDNYGDITPHKKGEVTITAKADPTDAYKAASASYRLTIVNTGEIPSVYNKVTSAADLEAGATYVIGNTAGTRVFKPELNGSNFKATENAVTVTATNGVITSSDLDDCRVVIDVLSSGYSIFVSAVNKYLYLSNGNMVSEDSATESRYTSISVNNNSNVVIKRGSGNYYLRYSSSDYFYESGTSSELALYMLDNGQPKERNLAFNPLSMSVNIYGKTTPYTLTGTPTLSGKGLEDVTYSVDPSDSEVASVDATTGEVTILGAEGSVTIVASAAANGNLLAGSASYTLMVTNTPPPTYTKVSEITSGATYLIVSTDINNYNGKGQKRAFAGDTSGSAVEVDGTSGTITGDYSACEFVITAEGEAYALNGPNGYVTGQSSTDPYIQVSETKVTMSLTDAATLKAASSSDGLVTDAFYFYYLKGSSTEALYLNTNGKFKIGGSGRKYGVYLYKKND